MLVAIGGMRPHWVGTELDLGNSGSKMGINGGGHIAVGQEMGPLLGSLSWE